MIDRHEGINQKDLGGFTGIDLSTLSDLVRRMQSRGLIQRERSYQDGRAYILRLTDRGRDLMVRAEPKMKDIETRLLAPLSQSQRSEFILALSMIALNLENMRAQEKEAGQTQ